MSLKSSKQTSASKSNDAAALTYTEFLVRSRHALSLASNRSLPIQSLCPLVHALRSAVLNGRYDNEDVTAGAYRVLRTMSRAPFTGPSCYLFVGKDAINFTVGSAAVEDRIEVLLGDLREGRASGDTAVPQNAADCLSKLEGAVVRSFYSFECSDEVLASVQVAKVSLAAIEQAASAINNRYYDVPQVLIELYLLAHAYCYNLSLLG